MPAEAPGPLRPRPVGTAAKKPKIRLRDITARDFARATIAAGAFLAGSWIGLLMLEQWLQADGGDDWTDGWSSQVCEKPVQGAGFGKGGGLYGMECTWRNPTRRETCVFGTRAEAEASAWRTAFDHAEFPVVSTDPVPDYPDEEMAGWWYFTIVVPTFVTGKAGEYRRLEFQSRNWGKHAWCHTWSRRSTHNWDQRPRVMHRPKPGYRLEPVP